MAIVLALLIVGWLLAFALGAQAGFENQSAQQPSSNPSASRFVQAQGAETSTAYREPASVA